MRASFLIGVAGPSGSGKSTFARQLAARIGGCGVLHADNYYRDLPPMTDAEVDAYNFDDPDAIDSDLLREHLNELAAGRGVSLRSYSFEAHRRTGPLRTLDPAPVWVVDGLHLFHWPGVRDLFDVRIFVEAGHEVCLERRLRRDPAERGQAPESVLAQYNATVRPMCDRFVVPAARHAHLKVDGTLASAEDGLRAALVLISPERGESRQ